MAARKRQLTTTFWASTNFGFAPEGLTTVLLNPFSDIHDDKKGNAWRHISTLDRDVVVASVGDFSEPATFETFPKLRKMFPDNRILHVMGNHDFYSDHRRPETKTTWEYQREHAPKVAAQYDIHLLDGGFGDGEIVIDCVRILGATLWTDFMARPSYVDFNDAVRRANAMNDYRLIKTGRGRSHDLLKPRDTIGDHKVARKWLETKLAEPFDGETVVLTHHAPAWKSLMAGHPVKDLDWCYASNLEQVMEGDNAPSLWVHGHIHSNLDYQVGATRIVANPRGYPEGHWYTWREGGPRENPNFDEDLLIEIGRPLTLSMGM